MKFVLALRGQPVLLLLLAVAALVFISGQLILGAVGLVVVGLLLGRSAFGWGTTTKDSGTSRP